MLLSVRKIVPMRQRVIDHVRKSTRTDVCPLEETQVLENVR